MGKIKDNLYKRSPVWMQNLGISVYGIYWKYKRFGPLFEKTAKEFMEREKWDYERLREYVEKSVRQQLKIALDKTSFYKETFGKIGLTHYDIEKLTIDGLSQLPLLEKESLRIKPDALLIEELQKSPPTFYYSSGTTGTPTKIYLDRATHQKIVAAREARSLRWAGVSYKEPRSIIGGRLVVPKAHSKPPFWRYNYAEKQLYMSAFHISPENVHDYIYALNHFKPVFMTGYASSHYFLARMILEEGINVHSPRAIITGSERLTPEMRTTIGKAFKARPWEEYSSVENCILATECDEGKLHINIDFGWIEILRDDGSLANFDEVGEIVATGLLNQIQPLIRYRTGDYGSIASTFCRCGRQLPILKELLGRLEDTVIGPDGREMVRFHGIFVGLPNIKEGQVIQKTLTNFTVNIVPAREYGKAEENMISQRFKERLGNVHVKIELVKNIPRTERGKFRAVISEVKRDGSRTN